MKDILHKLLLEEYKNQTITLYHGTCKENALNLVKNGWKPNNSNIGGNLGNPKYLYTSTDYEDAMWFANEKGCDSVVIIKNVPLEYIKPDPEDEAGFSMDELLDRINNSKSPAKFVIYKELNNIHFKFP